MIHCARENTHSCRSDHVTFGEFCILVDEQQEYQGSGKDFCQPASMLLSNTLTHGTLGRRKLKGIVGGLSTLFTFFIYVIGFP